MVIDARLPVIIIPGSTYNKRGMGLSRKYPHQDTPIAENITIETWQNDWRPVSLARKLTHFSKLVSWLYTFVVKRYILSIKLVLTIQWNHRPQLYM